MIGLQQTLGDLKLTLQTDRRTWAAGGFLCCVLFVWWVTGAWREEEEVQTEEWTRIRVEEEKIDSLIKDFNRDLKEGEEERQYLKDSITRFSQELKVEQDAIDWHVNVLVNKLNDMTERVDGIANQVGANAINKAQFEEKLKRQKANQKRKKSVDRSTL